MTALVSELRRTRRTPLIPPPKGRVVAEGDRVGVLFLQRCVYRLQNTDQIPIHVAVPKSQHAKSIADEMPVAGPIPRGVVIEIVLAAIDFDDQLLLQANEVDDETAARRLAAEMKAALAPRAQMNPQLDFLRRHCLAQLAGDLIGHERPHPAGLAAGHPPRRRGRMTELVQRATKMARAPPSPRAMVRDGRREKRGDLLTMRPEFYSPATACGWSPPFRASRSSPVT